MDGISYSVVQTIIQKQQIFINLHNNKMWESHFIPEELKVIKDCPVLKLQKHKHPGFLQTYFIVIVLHHIK